MRRPEPGCDVCVVGGAGHVGLPLGLVFAGKGRRVLLYDLDARAVERIKAGGMPFMEHGAQPLLRQALKSGRLRLTCDPAEVGTARSIIVTIGTPIDEFLNPETRALGRAFDALLPYLSSRQLVVLRSTVYPGTTEWLARYLRRRGKANPVAFCPERIVQGRAVEELQRLPQIVSGVTPESERRAAELFSAIAPTIVRLEPKEAEFAKLFCNAYRYIQFAVTNQFYMMATSAGLDYYRILKGIKQDYSRMRDLPSAGFAAGPCLLKDTMQLAASYNHEFNLGYTAMQINERLPAYIVERLERDHRLESKTVGLLGMAFKADNDDIRSSLSYKLKKVLQFRAKKVLTTDPHVANDPDLRPVGEVVAASDVLILCVPHSAYRGLKTRGKPVFDVWNFLDGSRA